MANITSAEIRMYRMGTGDCFVIKLLAGEKTVFKIMIDAGSWMGTEQHLTSYISDLKGYVDNYVDVLVVTHEHKDHVHAFDACESLFTDEQFSTGEIWMGWTEKDNTQVVEEWKRDYGEKKKILGKASETLKAAIGSDDFKKQFAGNMNGAKMLAAREGYHGVLNDFTALHMSFDAVTKKYKEGLAGMEVVKKKIKNNQFRFYKPGDMVNSPGDAENVKIYVLGPPEVYDDVKKEAGGEGESYAHNKVLRESDAFGAAVLDLDDPSFVKSNVLPFEEHFFEPDHYSSADFAYIQERYNHQGCDWRKIDYDWLFSAGSLALRMSGLTNNLSLALAIEVGDYGKVLLFPGDAEFGSWASWHRIPWKVKAKDEKKHFTEDLLNRTVFYKVAHHLSHNGTAQKLGLEMMKSEDLAAMATLDYSVITEKWKGTMPNRAIIKELLRRTKGRLMIMNEEGLFFDFNEKEPLSARIAEARQDMNSREKAQFDKNFVYTDPLYLQYTVEF